MPAGGTLVQSSSGGPFSFEGVVLNELIPFIEANYCASPAGNHRGIGGISRGGYWALEIAFRFPEAFASVGGHSAALLDTFAGPDINPQYTGLNNDLVDLRVYLDIGASDWVINNIRRLHEDMLAAGKLHTWVLNEGKHENAYWSKYLSDYLHWYSEPWSLERESYPHCQLENPG
jgi:enterochelin esterase-like enzyme